MVKFTKYYKNCIQLLLQIEKEAGNGIKIQLFCKKDFNCFWFVYWHYTIKFINIINLAEKHGEVCKSMYVWECSL